MATEKIAPASTKLRTIPANLMKSIAERLPMDGFKLDADILGQEYTVIDVITGEFLGSPTITVVLQNDKRIINLPMSQLKRARVLATANIPSPKYYNKHDKVVLRSDADSIWGGSKYFHTMPGANGVSMKTEESYEIPAKLNFEYAVLREDASKPGQPALNPFLYEGFRIVVDALKPQFPSMDTFRAELKKTGTDRIAGLPAETEPKVFGYVNPEALSAFGFTLILKDTVSKSE